MTFGSREPLTRTIVEAAAETYHPDASVVRLEQVHGNTVVAHGADGIRETMVYIGLKPHRDVIVHHTTVSGKFALRRSQWRITGTDQHGELRVGRLCVRELVVTDRLTTPEKER